MEGSRCEHSLLSCHIQVFGQVTAKMSGLRGLASVEDEKAQNLSRGHGILSPETPLRRSFSINCCAPVLPQKVFRVVHP